MLWWVVLKSGSEYSWREAGWGWTGGPDTPRHRETDLAGLLLLSVLLQHPEIDCLAVTSLPSIAGHGCTTLHTG